MTKVRCVIAEEGQESFLTVGKIYEFDYIDYHGDIWIKEDDQGDPYFMYPYEAEILDEE